MCVFVIHEIGKEPQACALIPWVPTLPSVVVNVAIGIRVEGPGVSIRSRGLGGVNRGGHLLSLGIAVVARAMVRDGMMSAVLIVAVPVAVAVGMAITLGIGYRYHGWSWCEP